MDENFWHQKWQRNEIAFHEADANPNLVKYFNNLALVKGNRVLVPLCGKTLDITWLLEQGYHVLGAELSEIAVTQLFLGLGVAPKISNLDKIKCYSATNIDIFVGNIFDITAQMLGQIDAVYDRAALVALPQEMRQNYTQHLIHITRKAPQLLITYLYNQNIMPGPPFSINSDEIQAHYKDTYTIKHLLSDSIPGGLKGCPAVENVWLLVNYRQVLIST